LREIILEAMGWHDYHLSEFVFAQEGIIISGDSEDDDWMISHAEEHLDESETYINEYLHEGQKFEFIYDFGDYWQHRIVVEKVVQNYEEDFPCVIKYKGNCPPEDVGGIWGYEDFLQVMENADDPEHDEMKEWAEEQGYRDYNTESTNNLLSYITVDQKISKKRRKIVEKKLSERGRQAEIINLESKVYQRQQHKSTKVITEQDIYQYVVQSATNAVELLLKYSVKHTDSKSMLESLDVRELLLVAETYEVTDTDNLGKEELVNRLYDEILKGEGLLTVINYLSDFKPEFMLEFSLFMHSAKEMLIPPQFPKEIVLLLASYCLVSFYYKGSKIYGLATKEAKEMYLRLMNK
jgi:hypothetical protein